ncbi:DUF2797 domain-containing protein [Haloarchaeobius sp. FL176]|uniref:DUF2797 domain-containing protein n=1 Tax=Haloarchaeobius sp. FL176 TaxID=2967129 RepID=UPI002147A910
MQVVGYRTETTTDAPALLLASDGTVEREPLTPGATLSFSLGDRWCAGSVDGDDHYACDRTGAPYCDQHTSRWPCARCTGNCDRPLANCREEHAVYLAAFAPDVFKVGVTKSGRLGTRLREQGADRGAHVHTVSDGRIARQLEAEYAEEIPDRVRVATKVAGLHASVDEAAWAALLDGFEVLETFAFDYGLALDARPVPETLLSGTVRGVQGRVLVLDRGGTTYAVDLRELVGYGVTREATDRRLQSSLGSFS